MPDDCGYDMSAIVILSIKRSSTSPTELTAFMPGQETNHLVRLCLMSHSNKSSLLYARSQQLCPALGYSI